MELERLTDYVLTQENISALLYKKEIIHHEKIHKQENVKDTLFWLFYKLYNKQYDSYPDYESENKIKFDLLTNYESKKSVFKRYNMKKENVEYNLLYDKIISITGFVALCLYNEINCILVRKNSYIFIGDLMNTDKETNYPIISIETNNYVMNNAINYKDYYELPCITKSIHSIGTYKVSELKDIASKNDIKVDGNKTSIYAHLKKNIEILINL